VRSEADTGGLCIVVLVQAMIRMVFHHPVLV